MKTHLFFLRFSCGRSVNLWKTTCPYLGLVGYLRIRQNKDINNIKMSSPKVIQVTGKEITVPRHAQTATSAFLLLFRVEEEIEQY